MEPNEKLILTNAAGARAELVLQGAHLTSWVPVGGSEQLYLSGAAVYRPRAAIRGGVPVIFPQFGGFGSLPKHGFARILPWELDQLTIHDGLATARLMQRDSVASRQVWNFPYSLSLTIELGDTHLGLRLDLENPGAGPLTFTAALHTYLRVSDLSEASLIGLGGQSFLDTRNGQLLPGMQTESSLIFTAETDRIYQNAPSPLVLQDPLHRVEIASSGFPDCVVWNPGPVLAARLADLESGGEQRFVCVEAAQALEPVSLPPGARWSAAQTLQFQPARSG
jgi:glucose-6-phosphate 1-epimerase